MLWAMLPDPNKMKMINAAPISSLGERLERWQWRRRYSNDRAYSSTGLWCYSAVYSSNLNIADSDCWI